MRKMVYAVFALLAILLLGVSLDNALTVSVDLSKDMIKTGETVTIMVTSSEDGTGYIKITMPDGTSQQIDITLSAGVQLSKEYPTDFQGGSTDQVGDYEVEVYVQGSGGSIVKKAIFWAGFTAAIPEYPLGTLTALFVAFNCSS